MWLPLNFFSISVGIAADLVQGKITRSGNEVFQSQLFGFYKIIEEIKFRIFIFFMLKDTVRFSMLNRTLKSEK